MAPTLLRFIKTPRVASVPKLGVSLFEEPLLYVPVCVKIIMAAFWSRCYALLSFLMIYFDVGHQSFWECKIIILAFHDVIPLNCIFGEAMICVCVCVCEICYGCF